MEQTQIFTNIIFRDKNKAVNFDKSTKNALNKVKKIKNEIDLLGNKELTMEEKIQIIKTKEKEENFLSQLNDQEKKKFFLKKKLFELISPLEQEENRIEEMIALAKIKNFPDIFKLKEGKQTKKVMNLFKLKMRNSSEIKNVVNSPLNKKYQMGGSVKYNLMNSRKKQFTKINFYANREKQKGEMQQIETNNQKSKSKSVLVRMSRNKLSIPKTSGVIENRYDDYRLSQPTLYRKIFNLSTFRENKKLAFGLQSNNHSVEKLNDARDKVKNFLKNRSNLIIDTNQTQKGFNMQGLTCYSTTVHTKFLSTYY